MTDGSSIVILTGAGISAESGVPTFRTRSGSTCWEVVDADGVTRYHRIEDICTPEALAADRALVIDFYDRRRQALTSVAPNPAHDALGRLDAVWPGELLIVTQNVDDLHERAGARRLIHMHGELNSALCEACGVRSPFAGEMATNPHCPACGVAALRPDIVFFGELPYAMEAIERALAQADLFVSIGTSGAVYPAAGFVQMAVACGADTLELNLDYSAGSRLFGRSLLGPASVLVPQWVAGLLDT